MSTDAHVTKTYFKKELKKEIEAAVDKLAVMIKEGFDLMVTKEEAKNFATKGDLRLLTGRVDGLDSKFDRLDAKVDRLHDRIVNVEKTQEEMNVKLDNVIMDHRVEIGGIRKQLRRRA